MADKAGARRNTIHADEQPAGRGSGERERAVGRMVEDESSCHWITELKWTRNAEVSDGTVEDGAGEKDRRKQRPQ